MATEGLKVEGEPSRRYGLSYHGDFLGSFDKAKEALKEYDRHNKVIRPVVDRGQKGRYSIRDGRKEITIVELRRAAKAEE